MTYLQPFRFPVTIRANGGRAFLFDKKNQLVGTNDSSGNYKGFGIQLLHTEKLMFSDGTVASKSPIMLALRDNLELDQNGFTTTASFINDLIRLTDVTVTVVSAASDSLVVSVAITCDGTPVNGLVAADFSVLTGAGATQAIGSVSEADGTYTITPSTSFASGTVALVTPEDLSIDAYDGTTTATVTIGS